MERYSPTQSLKCFTGLHTSRNVLFSVTQKARIDAIHLIKILKLVRYFDTELIVITFMYEYIDNKIVDQVLIFKRHLNISNMKKKD